MISVDWGTKVITIPQSYMTDLGGGTYELDMNQVRLDLKALEDDTEGMVFDDTHIHNTEVTISGVTYARGIEFINGYTITITPAGAYVVNCVGANHNLVDVYNNLTGPVVNPGNAAGLIRPVFTDSDLDAIADEVHNRGKLANPIVLKKGEDFNIEQEP